MALRLTATGLVAALLLLLAACGGGDSDGGGGATPDPDGPGVTLPQSIEFDPEDEVDRRISTPDGVMVATIPAAALDVAAKIAIYNRTATEQNQPGPTGRELRQAVELTVEVTDEPELPGDGSDDGTDDGTTDDPDEETPPEDEGGGNETASFRAASQDEAPPTLNSGIVVSITLNTELSADSTLPVYKYNPGTLNYTEAGVSGTVSAEGTELSFTTTEFGKFAWFSLLPEEIPPPAPGEITLKSATTQIRRLSWDAVDNEVLAGYNLYRSAIGAESFSAVNGELLTATSYTDYLAAPGGYEYYLTTVNTAGLESEAGPVLESPAVDFDLAGSFGTDRLNEPRDLSLSPQLEKLFVADPAAHCVWVYDLEGDYLERISEYGATPLATTTSTAINPGGKRLYVTEASSNRVYIFSTSDYTPVGEFGRTGEDAGEFQLPSAVEVVYDEALIGDKVLVVDKTISTLQSFTGLGVYLDTIATAGEENGQLDTPTDLLAANAGAELYVVDSANARVQKFNTELAYDSTITLAPENGGPFSAPQGIARDFRGRLYVTDAGNRRVVVFAESGEFLFHFGADGDHLVEFSEETGPVGIAYDPETGYLYVSDPGASRIMRFST